MPTRNVVLTDRQEDWEAARLEALRKAARRGVADIEAGRFTLLDDTETLQHHLAALAEEALAEPGE